jgi:hypothetical protein
MAGPLNGSGKGPRKDQGREDNVASLADARKRAVEKLKREALAARGPNVWRERIIGGVIILMALGMIVHWLAPLFQTSGVAR